MIKAIITDIEGTTSSISFVKDVLFPYAREHIGEFVREHADDENVTPLIDEVRKIINNNANLDDVIEQLIQWIDNDQKITPLKSLQGLIWEKGYQSGDFYGHIYQDAVEALRKWNQMGIKLYIYSSGSVYAQKLLFGHTEYGDLTPLFSGYFDTHIGAKNEPTSYNNIIKELNLAPDQTVFLSDIEQELDAARSAGLHTICLVRENDSNIETTLHTKVKDFHSITPLLSELK